MDLKDGKLGHDCSVCVLLVYVYTCPGVNKGAETVTSRLLRVT